MRLAADAARLAERYRAKPEAFTRAVIKHLKALPHAQAWWEEIDAEQRAAMGGALSKAFSDACRLDSFAVVHGADPSFLSDFTRSVFADRGFLRWLVKVAFLREDGKSMRPINNARQVGTGESAAVIAWNIRERMKEGYSAEEALRLHRDVIGRQIEAGDVQLIKALAVVVDETHKPTLQRWIIRAWLPLALWQEVPPAQKEERLHAAWKVAKASGVPLDDWPKSNKEAMKRKGAASPVLAMIRAARKEIERRQLQPA